VRLICVGEITVALRLLGAVGGVVSGGGEEYPELQLPVYRALPRANRAAQKDLKRLQIPREHFMDDPLFEVVLLQKFSPGARQKCKPFWEAKTCLEFVVGAEAINVSGVGIPARNFKVRHPPWCRCVLRTHATKVCGRNEPPDPPWNRWLALQVWMDLQPQDVWASAQEQKKQASRPPRGPGK
jgi:hypothetical protein